MRFATERWQRIKQLFDAAVDLPPDEQARLLENECAEDTALRNEIEALLRADARSDSFITQPAFASAADILAAEPAAQVIGRRFGAYEVVREIGRGGLGAVYLATRSDSAYRKEVAIKLVRRGLDTDDILQRFRHERQILAQLDDPNIARLIDGGTTDDGLPYFVMEYVAGQPIDSYCAENRLSIAERLALFRKVCAAVTYAHQNLVIHRDLKPSNILVNKEGEPKLLDFGIAKLLTPDAELVTMTAPALRVMTPEYASPEQIKGEKITTASDVYSLGVLLYELLTGAKPYRLKTRSPEEISRAVTDQEPARPSIARAGEKSLRRDLDNIVLMAMRKEPHRRYSSVAQFSDDIRRYLTARPVVAHRDHVVYRARKFVQRNRLAVAAALVLLATLIGGIVATSWEAKRATAEARVAARERDRAQKRFNDVRQLSNALLFDIAPKIERIQGSTEARKALVTRALDYLDSLANEAADDRQLQSEVAAAYEKIGELQGSPRKPNLNDFTGAMRSYEKARTIRTALLQTTHDDEQLKRIAGDLNALAALHWFRSDLKDSLVCSQAALDAYAHLLRNDPDARELRIAHAEAQIDLGRSYYYNEEVVKALPLFRDALATLQQLRTTDPDNSEILRLAARARTLLGITLSWNNKQAEGEAEMAQALQTGDALVARNPQDNVFRQGLVDTKFQAAQLFEDVDNARAFEYARQARDLAEEILRIDPADIQAQQNVAKSYSLIGQQALQSNRSEEAVGYLTKAAELFAELVKRDPAQQTYKHDQGRVLTALGSARQMQKQFTAAIEVYDKAAALFTELQRVDPGNNFHVRKLEQLYSYKGDAYRALAEQVDAKQREQHRAAAKDNYRRALDILQQLDAHQALSDYDRKELNKVQAALAAL